MANIELTLTPASPTGSMIFTLGAPGPQGLAGTMEVGTVTTGAPGSSATIVNVGTPSAAILDFEIPRGDKGDQGDPGPAGVVYATAPLSYDSGTQTISIDLSAYATQSFVTSQGYITSSALTPYLTSATAASTYQTLAGMSSYLTTSSASSTYLAKSGGYITGDIQSSNGSGYRTWDGSTLTGVFVPAYLQFNKSGGGGGALTVEWDGITFADGKQTSRYPGIGVLDGLYYPLTSNPAGYLTSASLSGYATESWVTSGFYSSSNPSGFISDAPSDGTIYGRQNGSWVTAGSSGAVWGSITGTLSDQTDLQGALNAKYDASNPSGFITSGDLYGYATESWVQSQGYLTSVPPVVLTNLTTSMNWDSYDTTSTLFIDGVTETGGFTAARLNFGASIPNQPNNGDFWFDGTNFRYGQGGAKTIASQSWVTANYYPLSSNPAGYAQLAGATFTGKVNLATISGAQTPTLNLGATVDPNATNAVSGDFWISNAASPKVSYKVGSSTYYCTTNNLTNTFSSPQVFDTTSNTLAAVRITQKGTFPALVVEDSTNPDTTATVIDANGNLGVGVDAATWTAANKVEIVGTLKATAFVNGTGPTYNVKALQAHSGGSDTHELLVSVNGSTYRIGMKFVSTP